MQADSPTRSRLAEQITKLDHCLLVIRHGQTEMNVKNLVSTRTDTALTPKGISDAQRLSESLRGIEFDHAYTSPLSRARQTLELVLGPEHELEIIEDARLIEPDAGPFEAINFDDLDLANHRHHDAWLRYQDDTDPVVPDGATDPAVAAREAVEFVQMVAQTPGRHIAASHGALVRLMATGFLEMPIHRYLSLRLDNCHCALWRFWDTPPYRHQLAGWNLS